MADPAHQPQGTTNQQVTAVMQQMHAAAQAQQATLEALQQQIAATAAHGGGHGGGRGGGPQPRLRLPELPGYNGRGPLTVWLNAMRHRFEYIEAEGPLGESQKILTAAQHLTDAALSWWRHLHPRPATYTAFEDALRANFQHVDTELEARQKLARLKQGAKQSVQDYAVDFRQLQAALPSEAEATRTYAFLQGLRPALASLVWGRDPRPQTLPAAIETSARLEAHGQFSAAVAGVAPAAASCGTYGGSEAMDLSAMAGGSEDSSEVTPMQLMHERLQTMQATLELQAARWAASGTRSDDPKQKKRYARTPGVTAAEIQTRRDQGECYACGSADHIKRYCPKAGGAKGGGKQGWGSSGSSN